MSAGHRVLLTPRNVPTLSAPGPGRTIWWDRVVPGFYLAVYPANDRFPDGTRSYGVWYRVRGRARMIGLGRHPAVTLKTARDRAREIIEAARVRRVDIGSSGAAGTLAELVAAYIEAARDQNPRTRTDSTLRSYEQMLATNLKRARIAQLPLEDVRRADVRELLRAVAAGAPAVATNLQRLLLAASRWAIGEELIERDPMAGVEKIGGSTSGVRVLRDDEIRILWRACAEEAAAVKSAALERGRGRAGAKWTRDRTDEERAAAIQRATMTRLLLLTAQRTGETALMEWPEIDRDARLWHIPAAHRKGQRGKQRPHVVPLSAAARAELQRIRSANTPTNKTEPDAARVFPWAAANHKHWIDPLRDRAAALGLVEHWTPHDLRRTAATGIGRLGFPRSVIALVLGHTMQEGGAVTGVYDRYDRMPERAAALEAWGAHVMALIAAG